MGRLKTYWASSRISHFAKDKKTRSRSLRMLQWAIVVAIFFFLGRMVTQNWLEVKEASFSLKLFPLFLSTLIFAFSYFIQIWAWYFITLQLGIAISFQETLESWFFSQFGKYLPGKVWLLLSRFYSYESRGKSKKAISAALYFETIILLMAGGILSLTSLLFFREMRALPLGEGLGGVGFFLVLAFFLIHPRVLQKMMNWILALFHKEPMAESISYASVMKMLLIAVLSWIVGGIGFYLFVESIFSVSSSHLLYLTGALAFSGILGFVAIFAPSGLGVREGTLVYILSAIMPVPIAVVISILTRIWITLIEIGLTGVIYLLGNLQRRRGKKNERV